MEKNGGPPRGHASPTSVPGLVAEVVLLKEAHVVESRRPGDAGVDMGVQTDQSPRGPPSLFSPAPTSRPRLRNRRG